MNTFKVTFYPDNKSVEVDQDKTILSAALSAGVYLTAACGGDGVCGRCKVIVKKVNVLTQPSSALTLAGKRANIFLACLTTVHGDLEVEVPATSRTEFQHLSQEELSYRLKGMYSDPEDVEAAGDALQQAFEYSPRTQKTYVELVAPTLDDQISDLEPTEEILPTVDSSVKVSLSGSNSNREVTLDVTNMPNGTEFRYRAPALASARQR